MSKINKVVKKTRDKKVVNHEGEVTYNYKAKEALATIVLNSFVQDKYYTSVGSGLNELKKAIKALVTSDPEFVLKAAAYARQEGNMRTISQVALVEALQHQSVRKFVKKYYKDIMQRADEPTECLAYHLSAYGKPIPNVLKRIVRARYEEFNEYQLSKYQLKNKEFTLKDGVLLTHPNLGEVGKKILEGTASADTWERTLSSGNFEDKAKAWEKSGESMGYMALLRNLRNMIDTEVNMKFFEEVCNKISNQDLVKKSRQLPFRFYSAYKELATFKDSCDSKNKKIMTNVALKHLEMALNHSVSNISISGRSLVVCDSSGSMVWNVSEKSKMDYAEIGVLMGVCCALNSDDSDVWLFDTDVQVVKVDRGASVMSNVGRLCRMIKGGATNFYKVVNKINHEHQDYDNIIIFSDMQVYGGNDFCGNTTLDEYLAIYPECKVSSVDLAGYNRGNALTIKGNVKLVSGWSDKIIDIIANDGSSIVSEIENYKVKNS